MATKTQPSFTGGVLSSALRGRTDFSKYQVALRQAINMFIHPEGGVSNRSGRKCIGEVPASGAARLIPFSFNTTQTYALLFQDSVVFVIKDGGYVIETSSVISGATQANPCVVTATAHTLNNGDYIYIDSIAGMTQLNGRVFQVANKAANTFELSGIDSSSYDAYVSGGAAYELYKFSTSYAEADLFDLKYTQDADTMIVTHPSYQTSEITRTGHTAWTLTAITWGTEIAAPATGTATPATAGSTTFDYAIVAVDAVTFEKSLPLEISATSAANTISATNNIDVNWDDVSGAGWYEVYRGRQEHYSYITTTKKSRFIDENGFLPNAYLTPPYDAGNFFDSADNRPSCATYFQQRLYLAGTNDFPQTVYSTQVGRFKNMNRHYPVQDDDSMSFTLNANEVNRIRHLIPLDSLLILTSGGEFVVDGGIGLAITPANISSKRRGSEGASNVAPIVIDDDVLFIQNKGGGVRSLSYKQESGGYIGDTISILASDYFKNHTIVDWCYSKDPDSVVWAVRDDGKLLSLVYLKKHEVYGWCEHNTDGQDESVCSIEEGAEDAVYMVCQRSVNGTSTRFVERVQTRNFTDIRDAFFVDCGVSLDVPVAITGATKASPVVITTSGAHGFSDGESVDIAEVGGMTEINDKRFIVANKTSTTFELTSLEDGTDIDGTSYTDYTSGGEVRKCVTELSNLYYLEGKSIVLLVDGQVHPELTVTNGKVTLEYAGSRIHAGLPYSALIETLDIEFQDTVRGKRQNIGNVSIYFKDSVGAYIGPSLDKLLPIKWREEEDYNQADALFTGAKDIDILPSWSRGGNFIIQQPNPLPLTILSLTPEVVLSD